MRQLRLRHLVGTLFRAAVADVLADFRGDFVRGDDVVGAVDFGEALAFGAGFVGLVGGGLVEGFHQMGIAERDEARFWHGGRAQRCCVDVDGTYSVACGELLLSADDSSATLGLVERSFASDNGLALRGTSAGLAADLGYGVPIV